MCVKTFAKLSGKAEGETEGNLLKQTEAMEIAFQMTSMEAPFGCVLAESFRMEKS
jgi:hypothetical protein